MRSTVMSTIANSTAAGSFLTRSGAYASLLDLNKVLAEGLSLSPVFAAASAASGSTLPKAMPVIGTAGNDTLIGTALNDTLYGGAGDDRLDGGAGNDLLYGVSGNDTLNGGAGNDYLVGALGDDVMMGGDGIDTATFAFPRAAKVDLNLTGRQQTGYGNDLLTGIENVTTGIGNDSVTGNGLANVVQTGGGNDTVRAGAGNDVVDGGLGNDLLDGGAGIDTLVFSGAGAARVNLGTTGAQSTGSYGVDTVLNIENVTGGAGADVITGNGQANVLTGGGGNDQLFGMAGADQLIGANGNDVLDGGAGNDVLTGGAGNDVIRGGLGNDTVVFNGPSAVRVALSLTRAQTTGHGLDQITDVENVIGGSGSDRVVGNDLSNLLYGNAGNDSLAGAAGSDLLSGGLGDDQLLGGVGIDVMIGGAGADQFIFRAGHGSDVIQDFQVNTDKIVIDSGASSFSQVAISQSGANTVLSFGDVRVTLLNVDHGTVDSGDFLFV
ncbi:calcium-binding protein [Paracoccus sp. p3-h83]|uniref:calcium-binding protein n=1 Tax=Paracoccus sp. p3-h83 TaxID=3342805 RepID=UPI0035B98E3E